MKKARSSSEEARSSFGKARSSSGKLRTFRPHSHRFGVRFRMSTRARQATCAQTARQQSRIGACGGRRRGTTLAVTGTAPRTNRWLPQAMLRNGIRIPWRGHAWPFVPMPFQMDVTGDFRMPQGILGVTLVPLLVNTGKLARRQGGLVSAARTDYTARRCHPTCHS